MSVSEIHSGSTFQDNKGQYIFYRSWKVNQSRGIVLVVHGLNSHSGYYHRFAGQLNGNGFDVYAMDLCGRGQSEGERFYVRDYRDLISDIDKLLNIARSAYPALPVFLLGHSAGGVFAAVYAVHHQEKLKGLILESIALQVPVPAFALATMKVLAHFIPHSRLVKLDNESFSRDPSIVAMMNADPLLAGEKQPVKTMQQLLLAVEYLESEMPGITLPLLVMHGTADKVTRLSGSKYLVEHVSSVDRQLKTYEGHYHDLLNDKCNGIVTGDIVNWLNTHSIT
ncbi:alpha/beta hydrolase [Flavihumibacter solisilvae]|uniref:Monoacylglycerol lipase n=1 Tax=Flavihumibacter solisilvae TaxID=1349421 RepID=A0A0C1L7F8_9BACT|nr:alpha/beta hydrolase [Flavihumibacter solisilvae]KIC95451.1 acylglycerol lipase [Flavihumibacter solisilvae]